MIIFIYFFFRFQVVETSRRFVLRPGKTSKPQT